jgi:BRCT domain type II-containing protein
MHVKHTITCIYIRYPEGEPSGSKHLEDIKKLKIKILVQEMCISLVYIV